MTSINNVGTRRGQKTRKPDARGNSTTPDAGNENFLGIVELSSLL